MGYKYKGIINLMSRMISKMFWAIIGLVVYFLLSLIGIDVVSSTLGGFIFIGVIFFISYLIKNSNN